MTPINKFEEIIAWQKARELTSDIYQITTLDSFSKDYELKSQIRKASMSIMLNIAEGFGRNTNKEFQQFLRYSLGSSTEVQSALYIALDQCYISEKQFSHLYDKANEIICIIKSFSSYLDKHSKPMK